MQLYVYYFSFFTVLSEPFYQQIPENLHYPALVLKNNREISLFPALFALIQVAQFYTK